MMKQGHDHRGVLEAIAGWIKNYREQHDLARGTAASHYREYCPNAISLDALFQDNRN